MTVASNDIARVDVLMDFNGEGDVINSYQFKKVAGGTISDTLALDDYIALIETLYTLILTVINAVVAFNKIIAFNKTTNMVIGQRNFPVLVAGSQGGDALPPGATGLINVATDFPGIQLRKYLPPTGEAENLGAGRIGPGAITAYGNFMAALIAPHVEVNGTYEYGYDSPAVLQWVLPTGANVNNKFAYQRRRKQGRGS